MQRLHLIGAPLHWLATPGLAFTAEILVGILVSIPFTVTILLGGLSSIPADIYEARADRRRRRLAAFPGA